MGQKINPIGFRMGISQILYPESALGYRVA